jgi:hypothetical protein
VLTAALAGEVTPDAVRPVEPAPTDPCSTWSDDVVAEAFDVPAVSSRPVPDSAPRRTCSYQVGDDPLLVVDEVRGPTRVASLLLANAESGGVVEQVRADGETEEWVVTVGGADSLGLVATPASLRTAIVAGPTPGTATGTLRFLLANRDR